jgi:hypothetical protein
MFVLSRVSVCLEFRFIRYDIGIMEWYHRTYLSWYHGMVMV